MHALRSAMQAACFRSNCMQCNAMQSLWNVLQTGLINFAHRVSVSTVCIRLFMPLTVIGNVQPRPKIAGRLAPLRCNLHYNITLESERTSSHYFAHSKSLLEQFGHVLPTNLCRQH